MGQALLVNIDLDTGAEILRILDEAGPQSERRGYGRVGGVQRLAPPRFPRQLDAAGPLQGSGWSLMHCVAAGFPVENTPSVLILPTTDPTVRALRRTSAKARTWQGMRMGGQQFGNRWVEDGYVYRVS
jgi:hypothetical protein